MLFGNSKRKIINFRLEVPGQTRQSIYYAVLSVGVMGLFAVAGLSMVLRPAFSECATASCLVDFAGDQLGMVDSSEVSFVILAFLTNFTVAYICGLVITHRTFGPMVPINRHIQALRKGDYQSRVVLRKHDNMIALAEELNGLAEDLEKQAGRSDAVRRAS